MKLYKGKKVLVVGLARTGIAAAEFLLQNGAEIIINDIQAESALAAPVQEIRAAAKRFGGEVRFELGRHDPQTFRQAELVVVSPGVPMAMAPIQAALAAGIAVISEIELAFRHLRGRIIGITGSNGKTTTTTLAGEVLKAGGLRCCVAGNIGSPLIGFVEDSTPEDLYVTEISSFQLEGIARFRPFIGVLLNITPNHMDRYSSFAAYAKAKYGLFGNQTAADYAILNADNAPAAGAASALRSNLMWFSRHQELDQGLFRRGDHFIFRNGDQEQTLLSTSDIPLKGGHNQENVLAALAVGILCRVEAQTMQGVVSRFPGVEHRLEFVCAINGVDYYNDSKATSVDATIKVIESFAGNLLLILGGKDKGGDFTTLRAGMSGRVKHVLLIGAAGDTIARALEGCVPMTRCADLNDVVAKAAAMARPGDTIVLAPACASFDMFDNFEHRGRVFKAEVLAYKNSIPS
ncbi:MAG: UDP-N-acetylmuramoyl-L-alanine--D-glutamate ligase [Acidobacteria bacterium]|nr:UDP-N-acetylmuramoyl-L-alanine--D-glutamate ligase [Acidobacteriota bacterium]MBI3657799.1 UDP-N-acetylmuramoyl-L-alanine--D-glutamate ligase [Acidobacteriota bacterium]